MATTIFAGIFLGFCLALSFLFSGMEAGVFALSRLRVRQLMRAGGRSAGVLHRFLENPEDFLWTILLGNTVVNFIILGWAFATLHAHLSGHPVWLGFIFAVIVFWFYVWFDLLPKMLFRMFPNRLCMAFAPAFRFVHLALHPAVALLERCSVLLLNWTGGKAFFGLLFGNREELVQLMQESAQSFTSEERTMINRVLDLQSLTVRQIMKPIALAVTVNAQMPVAEILKLAREKKVARLPVWEHREHRRRVGGMVSVDALLQRTDLDPAKPAAAVMNPALFLDENSRLEVALRRMQRGGYRLAVVLARDGHEAGIVALEDILGVIFGKVRL